MPIAFSLKYLHKWKAIMENFKFGIMGAGNIAQKFVDAVSRIKGAKVCAVASKSFQKAEDFAKKHNIPEYFDSYEQMLKEVKLDCVYIATTPESHFALSELCVKENVPVICEKAMFPCFDEAKKLFEYAESKKVFTMEAMWSRFLPANIAARNWIKEGKIGKVVNIDTSIGFISSKDPNVRFLNPKLCGGATTDITVYGFELTTWMMNEKIKRHHIEAVKGETGVDVTNTILLTFESGAHGIVRTSLETKYSEGMIIYGTKGKIVIPHPHYADEAYLYNFEKDKAVEHFKKKVPNGFIYEINEAIECIKAGKVESDVIPHKDTLECAKIFDEIYSVME